jgi:hypothetical protein
LTRDDVVEFVGPFGDLRHQITGVLVDASKATIYFESQIHAGEYRLTIGPDIRDLAGNGLDQNQDGISGQPDDGYTATVQVASPNLSVASVGNPTNTIFGNTLNLSWTVANRGSDAADGLWWDYVYLSSDAQWDREDRLVAKVPYDSNTRGIVQANGGTYIGSVAAAMPGVLPGPYHVLVRTNVLSTLAETDFSDNFGSSATRAHLDLPRLVDGSETTFPAHYRDDFFYRIDIDPSQVGGSIVVHLVTEDTSIANALYLGLDRLPSPVDHDRTSPQGLSAEQRLVIPNIQAGTYYLLASIAPASFQSGPIGAATLRVEVLMPEEFHVFRTHLGAGGTAGLRTFEIQGTHLTPDLQVRLAGPSNSWDAVRHLTLNTQSLFATFDLTQVPEGTYTVTITNPLSQQEVDLLNAVDVIETTGTAAATTQLSVPPAFRRVFHTPYVTFPIAFRWENTSLNDIPVPMFLLSLGERAHALRSEAIAGRGETLFGLLGHGSLSPPGILMPGDGGVRTWYVVPRLQPQVVGEEHILYTLETLLSDPLASFDWTVMGLRMDRRGMSPEDFNAMLVQFRESIGETEREVGAVIRQHLPRLADINQDIFQVQVDALNIAFRDFLALRSTSLRGQILLSHNRELLPNLRVIAEDLDANVRYETSPLPDGTYAFTNMAAGTYQLVVTGGAHLANPEAPVNIVDGVSSERSLAVQLSSQLVGSVLFASDGMPVAGSDIQLESVHAEDVYVTRTDALGSLTFNEVPAGEYRLLITSPWSEPIVDTVTLAMGKTHTLSWQAQRGAAITGRILFADGVEPIAGATVTATHLESLRQVIAVSRSDGRYELLGLEFGTWSVVAHSDTHAESEPREVNLAASARANLDLSLQLGASLSGTVVSANGVPVAGAEVSAMREGRSYQAVTEESGAFRLQGLQAGDYVIEVLAAGLASNPLRIEGIILAEERSDIEIRLVESVSYSVSVTDDEGTPTSGAAVWLVSSDSQTSGITDSEGKLTFPDVVPGRYVATVWKSGFVGKSFGIELASTPSAPSTVQLTAGATIVGQVPLEQISESSELFAVVYNAGGFVLAISPLDDEGAFHIGDLSEGEYFVMVRGEGVLTAPVAISVGSGQTIPVQMTMPLGAVLGSVEDMQGEPIAEATLVASRVDTHTGNRWEIAVTTDQEGQFRLQLPPGAWTFSVIREGFANDYRRVDVTGGDQPTQFLLSSTVPISGRIVDVETQQGIAQAILLLRPSAHPEATPEIAVVDSQGAWTLSSLKAGTYDIVVFHDNKTTQFAQVELSSDGELQLAVSKQGLSISGSVFDPTGELTLSGITVSLIQEGRIVAEATTDGTGRYRFDGLEEGAYDVSVGNGAESNATTQPGGGDTHLNLTDGSPGTAASHSEDEEAENVDVERLGRRLKTLQEKDAILHDRYDAAQKKLHEGVPNLPPLPIQPENCDCLEKWKELRSHYDSVSDRRDILVRDRRHSAFNYRRIIEPFGNSDGFFHQNEFTTTKTYEEILSFLRLIAPPIIGIWNPLAGSAADKALWLLDQLRKFDFHYDNMESSLTDMTKDVVKLEAFSNYWASRSETFKTLHLEPLEKAIKVYLDAKNDANAPQPPEAPWTTITLCPDASASGNVLGDGLKARLDRDFGGRWRVELLSELPEWFTLFANGDFIISGAEYSLSVQFRLVIDCEGPIDDWFSPYRDRHNTYGQIKLVLKAPEQCEGCEIASRYPSTPDQTMTVQCGSVDPNDILGPAGSGELRWVQATTTLDYTIRFENDAEKATAPAAVVRVEQVLDEDLDLSSFRLGSIGFGDVVLDLFQGRSSFVGQLSFIDSMGIMLDVRAGVDLASRTAFWELRSIDPETGEVPFNPFMGFLPPNRNGTEGQGFLKYSIRARTGAETGTRIDAMADIVFDQNEAIATPPIFNTLDNDRPTSRVQPLPARSRTEFEVVWDVDDQQGSGVSAVDVYVSVDGQPASRWLAATQERSAIFVGQVDRNYAFYSIATDGVGLRESQPSSYHTSTRTFAASAWHNLNRTLDVDGDQSISPLDVLLIVNFLNSGASANVPSDGVQPPPFGWLDVDNDSFVTPLDALLVINYLNSSGGSEGEGA